MNDEQIKLARRLVAHPRWRWMPGMLMLESRYSEDWMYLPSIKPGVLTPVGLKGTKCAPVRIWSSYHGELCDGVIIWSGRTGGEEHEVALTPGYPDLTDPATIGCLAALVREVWGDPVAYCESVYQDGPHWYVYIDGTKPYDAPEHDTEGDAWARALLAYGGDDG